MNKINAAITRMEEVEIFGIPALFTPKRISRDTLHLQLFCYEMQAQLGEVEPFILTDHVEQEFYGTVLSLFPIDLTPDGRRPIFFGDFRSDIGEGSYTPAEFEEKYLSPYFEPEQAVRYGKD